MLAEISDKLVEKSPKKSWPMKNGEFSRNNLKITSAKARRGDGMEVMKIYSDDGHERN